MLYLRPAAVIQMSQQLSFGLHEILKTTAANIHTMDEWSIIFMVLEYVGAGKVPPTLTSSTGNPSPIKAFLPNAPSKGASTTGVGPFSSTLQHSHSQDPLPQYPNSGPSSGSDRGYTSDSELEIKNSNEKLGNVSPAQSWILVCFN